MRSLRFAAVAAALALPLAMAGTAAAQESVQIQLDPLNDSGASGTATLTPTGDGGLQVEIDASGLVPNAPHAQHLHGAVDGTNFMCPTPSADEDGDGFVSTVEGLPAYGDVFISLTTEGDTSKSSGLALDRFPTADADGNLSYERTIPAGMVPEGTIEQLENLHIVQHGIDVDGNDKYNLDSPIGESPFASSLGVDGVPAEGTFPATCGMVAGAAAGVAPEGGVETGDGTSGMPMLVVFGGMTMAGAAGALAVGRLRSARRN